MRRFISVICILCLLLSVPAYAQPVTPRTTRTALETGGFFTISPAIFTTPGQVDTLIPLSDGRVLVGGRFVSIGGQAALRSLVLIKSDGSLDATFQVDPNLQVTEIYAAAVQSTGKIVIAGQFHRRPSPFTYYLLRLNANGTLDDTFNTTSFNAPVYSILTDGVKIVAGGNFTLPTPRLARLNQDGSADATFNGMGSGPSGMVRGIARQSNGKFIIVGEFATFNGTPQAGLARLNTNGSLDTAFVPGGFRASQRVVVLNDNSVVVGGEDICGDTVFAWYTVDGIAKPTPAQDPNIFQSITALLPLADGGFLVGGWYSAVCVGSSPTQHQAQVWRYASTGAYQTMTSFGDDSDVLALALRSDGKVLLGGQGRPAAANQISLFDGLALLDLSNNGLEEVSTFHPLVGNEAEIYSLSRYLDGRLLVAGNFSHVNGSPRFGLARLLANGNLDPDFHPFAAVPQGWSNAALALPDGRAVAGFVSNKLYLIGPEGTLTDLSALNNYDRVSTLAYQGDGKVLVGSDFGLGVRRLKADFTGLDTTFMAGDASGAVYALAVQTDTKILVAGSFSQYNTVNSPGLVRLNSNGDIDSGFTPPAFMLDESNTATLYSVTPITGGNVLVGGNFSTVGGADHPAVVRLNSGGALDATFTSPTGVHTAKTSCVQEDGSIWIGGTDSSSYRDPLVLHLTEDGSINSAFQSAYQAAHYPGSVNVVLCNTDELSWAAGKFSSINNHPFYGLARYLPLRAQVFLPLIVR